MNAQLNPKNANDADLCGLPQRANSPGRDPLEEVASLYLELIRSGRPPDLNEFVKQYPHIEQELREFLPLVGAMEDWKVNQEISSIKQPLPEQFSLERLGDCRIIREIARGGMGVVFEAEQESVGRRVAVKLLPWRFPRASTLGQQFQREARIAARLQHNHIVPVFNFGEHDGHFYYVMQLIEGVGLDRLIEHWRTGDGVVALENVVRECHPELRLPQAGSHRKDQRTRRILRSDGWQQLGKIAAQIAGALRFAHKHGTLHRDIKPGNILIDFRGHVWMTDFGLALAQDATLSGVNEPLMGTLRYMAPEQFSGTTDVRSDIYSFGITLFELCTLQPAFTAQTKQDLIREVQNSRIQRPRSLNPKLPAELEKIIIKAVHRDPGKRHQTAKELHADLLGFVNRTSSRETPSLWGHIRKWF